MDNPHAVFISKYGKHAKWVGHIVVSVFCISSNLCAFDTVQRDYNFKCEMTHIALMSILKKNSLNQNLLY